MEDYKKVVQNRLLLCNLITLLSTAFLLIQRTSWFQALQLNSMMAEVQSGLIVGIAFLSIALTIRYQRVKQNEEKLKTEYNKEHDERQQYIRLKAGMPMLMITSSIMILASIIAGYFHEVVFYSLFFAALGQLSFGVLIKLYYMKTL